MTTEQQSDLLYEDALELAILERQLRRAYYEEEQIQAAKPRETGGTVDASHEARARTAYQAVQALEAKIMEQNKVARERLVNFRTLSESKRPAGVTDPITHPFTVTTREINPDPTPKSIKVKDPSPFSGLISDYRRFIFACKNVIAMRKDLDTDEKKIRYIGTLLEGMSFIWYENYIDQLVFAAEQDQHPILYNYDAFLDDFQFNYKDPMEMQTNRSLVINARQEKMSFNDYAVYFKSLCQKAYLDVDQQVNVFLKSLNDHTKAVWKPHKVPITYNDAVKSIQEDLQVYSLLHSTTTKSTPRPPYTSKGESSNSKSSSSPSGKPFISNPNLPGVFAAKPDGATYMYRVNAGLCARCGMKAHKTDHCTTYPKSVSNADNFQKWIGIKNAASSVNTVKEDINIEYYPPIPDDVIVADNKSNSTNYFHLGIIRQKILPLFLVEFIATKTDGSKAPGKALVDSGANRSLIGRNFVKRNHIETSLLPEPLYLTLADGKTTSVVTKRIPKIDIEVNGHKGNISLPILENHGYDLILGLDWLSIWNPHIDWSTQTLTFNDAKPSTPLIQEPRKNEEIQINTHHTTPSINPTDISNIPPVTWPMSEFPQIFDMKKQSYLPLVKPGWDFDVEFKEGVPLPKNRPLFRLPMTQRKAVEEYVNSERESGKIRVSNSPIAANLFFVPKGDSATELRPCVDYRDLNSSTKDDKYPLPPLSDLIQSLVGGDWYSKLDWRWAYNNLRIVPGSEWKFAFKCHMGQFEPLVMPFGPKQAPSHMQRYVSEMCMDFIKEGWLHNILDDFIIKTVGTIEDHKDHIRRYLERIQELGIFIKESKCLFFQKEIPFVGFMVNRFGYWKQNEKMEAIKQWGVPSNVKEVRAFLGYVNFYRPFASHLSTIAQPLFDLTKKSHDKFRWLPIHQEAFTKVKECLLEDIFLLFPDHTKPFIIHFDSSDLGTGSVLQQYDINGVLRPLEFYSKKWNAAEFNYSTPDKELYGLILALKHWYSILFGANELIIYTDHKSLRDFSKTQLLKPRHARWALVLEDFRSIMKIHWIPGSKNQAADACSRDPRFKLTEVELMDRSKQTLLPEEVFEQAQLNVLSGLELHGFMEPAKGSEGIQLKTDSGGISFIPPQGSQSSEFMSNVINDTDEDSQLDDANTDSELDEEEGEIQDTSLRTPQSYQTDITGNLEKQQDVMSIYHDSILGGHLGIRKTLEIIRRRYWWKGMKRDISAYIASCDICQKNKKIHQLPLGKLMPLPIPDKNWQHVSMDFIVKLPKSSTFDSILVVVDRRSKQSHFIPCNETITAEGTAMLVFNHVICKHGLPQTVISDRGPQFRSRFWKKLLELLGSKASLSTAYHPQTDGQSERVNQTLEQYLRCFTSYEQDDWSQLLPLAELVYNNSFNESIGMSPLYAATGQDAEIEVLGEVTPVDQSNPPEAGRIKEHFGRIYIYLNEQLQKAQARYKATADVHRREEESYEINDKVLLSTKNIRTLRPTKKLDVTYIGPYRVKRRINPVTYELEMPDSKLYPVYHTSLLKRYIQSEDKNRTTIQPPSIRINDEEGYILKNIIDVRKKGNGYQYLIDWDGYGPEDRTWEPRSSLKDDDLLRDWHSNNPTKPSPFTPRDKRGHNDTIVSIVLPQGSPSSDNPDINTFF